jgi:hypothetical protein
MSRILTLFVDSASPFDSLRVCIERYRKLERDENYSTVVFETKIRNRKVRQVKGEKSLMKLLERLETVGEITKADIQVSLLSQKGPSLMGAYLMFDANVDGCGSLICPYTRNNMPSPELFIETITHSRSVFGEYGAVPLVPSGVGIVLAYANVVTRSIASFSDQIGIQKVAGLADSSELANGFVKLSKPHRLSSSQ